MEKKEVVISAKEAEKLAQDSPIFRKHIFKAIKESAKEGFARIFWGIQDINETLLRKFTQELLDLGYSVEILPEQANLRISW